MCPECKKKHIKWPAKCEFKAAARVANGRDKAYVKKYDTFMRYCKDNNLNDPESDLPGSYTFGRVNSAV